MPKNNKGNTKAVVIPLPNPTPAKMQKVVQTNPIPDTSYGLRIAQSLDEIPLAQFNCFIGRNGVGTFAYCTNFRVDVQSLDTKVNSRRPSCYNLQVQANKEGEHGNIQRRLTKNTQNGQQMTANSTATYATLLVERDGTPSPERVKSILQDMVKGLVVSKIVENDQKWYLSASDTLYKIDLGKDTAANTVDVAMEKIRKGHPGKDVDEGKKLVKKEKDRLTKLFWPEFIVPSTW